MPRDLGGMLYSGMMYAGGGGGNDGGRKECAGVDDDWSDNQQLPLSLSLSELAQKLNMFDSYSNLAACYETT